jgi:hypothetical protein
VRLLEKRVSATSTKTSLISTSMVTDSVWLTGKYSPAEAPEVSAGVKDA